MRQLVYLVAATLDGFVAGPDRGDPSGTVFELEGAHAAPLMAEYPEMIPFHLRRHVGMPLDQPPRHFDTVLEGRGSYELGLATGTVNAYPHLHHVVFSTTLTELPDPSVELVRSDPVGRVRELKQQDGLDIWLCGGGALAASLRDEIDEIHLKLNPVVLGAGVPLLDASRGGPVVVDLYRLRECRPFDSGVALMVYERRR